MHKLDLEKREEPEIKLLTSVGSQKEQGNSRKISTTASLTMLKSLTMWITTNCGKILKEVRIPHHFICLQRHLNGGQEATIKTGHGTTDQFKIGKGVGQDCRLLPCLTYMQSTSCEIPGWMKCKLESRLMGEISITSDIQITPPLGRKQRGTKELLNESER